jgi:hypothetical protein
MINILIIRSICDRYNIVPLDSIDEGVLRSNARLGGAVGGVVYLVTALAALVRPGEVGDGDDEETVIY